MNFRFLFLRVLLVAALPGCASVSVKNAAFVPGENPVTTPETIYLKPFLLPPSVLRVDRTGENLSSFALEFQAGFAEKLATRLTKHIAPSRVVGAAEVMPRSNAWLIEGEFQRIFQGSRALRSVVGCGLGGTKMECTARVYDLRKSSREPFAIIATTGGSNAEPGAIFSGPFGAVPRILLTSATSGVSPDARRTARMITASLSEYLAKAHAQLPVKPLRAKQLGEVPGLISKPSPRP